MSIPTIADYVSHDLQHPSAYMNLQRFFNMEVGKIYSLRSKYELVEFTRNNPMSYGAQIGKIVAFVLLSAITLITFIVFCALRAHVMKDYEYIAPIAANYTVALSIEDQRMANMQAKDYMATEVAKLGGTVEFVSLDQSAPLTSADVTIEDDLDASVFKFESVMKVQHAMGEDAKNPDIIALYGAASQFNCGEAKSNVPVPPGHAEHDLESDHTQGPGVQRMYSPEQVEVINAAGHKGLNMLAEVLDETTKHTVKGGYLTPATTEDAAAVIERFKTHGHEMQFPCVGNSLREAKDDEPVGARTEKVYMMLASTAAFSAYLAITGVADITITPEEQAELAFQATLLAYRAQFKQGIELATANPEKSVVVKPTGHGIGAFGNSVDSVAKAYYTAAKEYEAALRASGVVVTLQVRQGSSPENLPSNAEHMAAALHLNPVVQAEAN